ncbi:type I-C CRISPR-associated protein Cas7/Csd2 [Bradyrhizobium sp. USDA 4353]
MTAIENRYDIVFLFDVTDGNPNGDPDAGNMPRLDPETNVGLVSDVSLKRKIRNYVELTRSSEPRYSIYVQEGAILNEQHRKAYLQVRKDDERVISAAKLEPKDHEAKALTRFMCDHFFDVRTFGAVMSTGINCGQVRGPVQLAFARSVQPVMPLEISITRMAATNKKEKGERVQGVDSEERADNRTMGRKHIIPYGLYRAHIFVNAKLAERTGFAQADLELLFDALKSMFEHDRSAARGMMSSRKIVAFKHASAIGNAPAHDLFDRVIVQRKFCEDLYDLDSQLLDNLPPARRFCDYSVSVDRNRLPRGVEVLELM